MKLLYLDFDGVLHHESVYFHPKLGISDTNVPYALCVMLDRL